MRWTRHCRVGVLFLIALLGNLAVLSGANAQTTTCRTDPTVTLSNGRVVTLWANISTDISQVKTVSYVLHVPKGVSAKSISYDSNGSLESIQIVADQTGTHYADNTTAYTTTAGIPYSAYATRQDATVASKSGKTDTEITLNWCT